MPDITLEEIHEAGAERHGILWLKANEHTVNIARHYDFDFTTHKCLLSHITLFVLDAAKRYHEEE